MTINDFFFVFLFITLFVNSQKIKKKENLLNHTRKPWLHPPAWRRTMNQGHIPDDVYGLSVVEYENYLYSFGGCNADECYENVYVASTKDLRMLFWMKLIPKNGSYLPNPRVFHSMNVVRVPPLDDFRIYIFGGKIWKNETRMSRYTNDLIRMIPESSTNQVSFQLINTDDGPAPRGQHSATSISDLLLVFGGETTVTIFGDFWKFQTNVNKWERIITDFSPPPRKAHAAAAFGDQLFIFGGLGVDGSTFSDLWQFDILSHRWTKPVVSNSQMPKRLFGASAITLGNSLLFIGGCRRLEKATARDSLAEEDRCDASPVALDLENPITYQWRSVIGRPQETLNSRLYPSAVLVKESIIVLGGLDISDDECWLNPVWAHFGPPCQTCDVGCDNQPTTPVCHAHGVCGVSGCACTDDWSGVDCSISSKGSSSEIVSDKPEYQSSGFAPPSPSADITGVLLELSETTARINKKYGNLNNLIDRLCRTLELTDMTVLWTSEINHEVREPPPLKACSATMLALQLPTQSAKRLASLVNTGKNDYQKDYKDNGDLAYKQCVFGASTNNVGSGNNLVSVVRDSVRISGEMCPLGCSSNGYCSVDGKCLCSDGFTGTGCEMSIDDRQKCPNNCSFKGKCKEDSTCVCDIGFTGSDCSITDYCPNECGHGICDMSISPPPPESGTPGGGGSKCICKDGWSGYACDISPCEGGCGGRGACSNIEQGGDGETCVCFEGWTGNGCETAICLNNCAGEGGHSPRRGTCDSKEGRCKCHPGFSGAGCEIIVPSKCPQGCVHGNCIGAKCQCDEGWDGVDCSSVLCPNICSNNGNCVSSVSKPLLSQSTNKNKTNVPLISIFYQKMKNEKNVVDYCHCNKGYEGQFCEYTSKNLEICGISKCSGRGKCINGESYVGLIICQ
eukprot:GHVL01013310.1.p1 GENE.GHVL01013310.1~~GHVL01013310.1.p1  ORF type:complete len:905 (+),score=201.94 GHVL01013310.1:71-2785(+)